MIEIEQHKLIVEKSKELLDVCLDDDREYIKSVIEKSQQKINDFNEKNLTVVDFFKKELGSWSSTVKKIIYAKYCNPIIDSIDFKDESENYEYMCEKHKIYDDSFDDWFFDLKDLCESCKNEYYKREKNYIDFYKKKQKIFNEFKNACEKTNFSEELKAKYILLNRKVEDIYKLKPLEKSIKEVIRIEILKTFQKQNQELITKYL